MFIRQIRNAECRAFSNRLIALKLSARVFGEANGELEAAVSKNARRAGLSRVNFIAGEHA